MSKTYKNCQSCGMPLRQDPAGGGTEADGRTSQMYCSYCYEGGEFLQPEMTAAEMKSLVKSKLKEMKVPGFLASFYASGVPKLKRWRS